MESDEADALEWVSCTVRTPCNSPVNSRKSGFKDDREAADAQLLSEPVGCPRELCTSDSKEDSGIPDGNVMGDGGVGDEVTVSGAVETQGKVLKPANLISAVTEIQDGKVAFVYCKKSEKEQLNDSANRKAVEDAHALVRKVLLGLLEQNVGGSCRLLVKNSLPKTSEISFERCAKATATATRTL